MPMLYPPKPVRSHDQHVEAEFNQLDAAARKAERRRRERLFEIEFFAHDDDASPPGSRAALEAMEYPAHASSAVILSLDPRLARAIVAAANGWVVERYR